MIDCNHNLYTHRRPHQAENPNHTHNLTLTPPPRFSPSLPLLPSVEAFSPKLTKTDRKGEGVQKSAIVHQHLTTTKTDRPVSFPFHIPEHADEAAGHDRNLALSALICPNLRRSALFFFRSATRPATLPQKIAFLAPYCGCLHRVAVIAAEKNLPDILRQNLSSLFNGLSRDKRRRV
jgi:hypothetical protein